MATSTETKDTAKDKKRPRVGRSPAYPYISLRKAVHRAQELWALEGKHYAPMGSAYKAWELGEKSSGARQTAAALGHYGLAEFQGEHDKRQVRLTERAQKIVLDKRPESPDRDQLLQAAALSPSIYAEMWGKWRAELPSDSTIEAYLVLERGYNPSAAPSLLADYKDTIDYAKLSEPVNMPDTESGDAGETNDDNPNDNNDLERRRRQSQRQKAKIGMKEDVFTLKEGDVIFQWPETLSSESYEDLVSWTELVLRKVKRHIANEGEDSEPHGGSIEN